MTDIGYTVIDFILKLIVVASISAILLLLGVLGGIAYYIIERKRKSQLTEYKVVKLQLNGDIQDNSELLNKLREKAFENLQTKEQKGRK